MSSQTKVTLILLLKDDVFKSCTVEKTSKNIILAPEAAVSQYITFFQNLYYYAYGRGHVIPVFKTCFFSSEFLLVHQRNKKMYYLPTIIIHLKKYFQCVFHDKASVVSHFF